MAPPPIRKRRVISGVRPSTSRNTFGSKEHKERFENTIVLDDPRRRVPRAGRRAQEDEYDNVCQRIDRMERKIDFFFEYMMKLVALVEDKLQLDVSQLPQFNEGQSSRVQEPDKEDEEEQEMKSAHLEERFENTIVMDNPRHRAPRAERRAQEDEDDNVRQRMDNVHQRMDRVERQMDFLVDHQMKIVAFVANKLQLDVSQLPQFNEGQSSGVQEPDEEGEAEEEMEE